MNKALLTIVGFALIGCASTARTQAYVMPNKGGGEITITARPCVINGETVHELREAYTWSTSTPYQKACWTIIDGNVHILYIDTKDRRVYPIEAFREKR